MEYILLAGFIGYIVYAWFKGKEPWFKPPFKRRKLSERVDIPITEELSNEYIIVNHDKPARQTLLFDKEL